MIETITHFDTISIKNVLAEKFNANKSPILGLVRIFENGILNTDQSEDGWLTNMTIATGREFVAQCLYKKNSPSSLFGNIYDYKLDSFGVGSGGASIDSNNNVTLNGPELCDIGMYRPVALNSNCLAANNNNNVSVAQVVKKIESNGPGNTPGSIIFQVPSSSDFQDCGTDYFSVVKNVCIIDNQEPTFLNPGESVKIDEAMLFFTKDTQTYPFAHICFAPKFIELETVFSIEWYVIC